MTTRVTRQYAKGWTLSDAFLRHYRKCPHCALCIAGETILEGVDAQSHGALPELLDPAHEEAHEG